MNKSYNIFLLAIVIGGGFHSFNSYAKKKKNVDDIKTNEFTVIPQYHEYDGVRKKAFSVMVHPKKTDNIYFDEKHSSKNVKFMVEHYFNAANLVARAPQSPKLPEIPTRVFVFKTLEAGETELVFKINGTKGMSLKRVNFEIPE
jgi:hypothetical protein